MIRKRITRAQLNKELSRFFNVAIHYQSLKSGFDLSERDPDLYSYASKADGTIKVQDSRHGIKARWFTIIVESNAEEFSGAVQYYDLRIHEQRYPKPSETSKPLNPIERYMKL